MTEFVFVTVALAEPQVPVIVNEGVIISVPLTIDDTVPAPIEVSLLPPGAAIVVTITGVGASGPPGPAGTAGPGVPVGGTTDQLLSKVDGTDYNTEWKTDIDAGYF